MPRIMQAVQEKDYVYRSHGLIQQYYANNNKPIKPELLIAKYSQDSIEGLLHFIRDLVYIYEPRTNLDGNHRAGVKPLVLEPRQLDYFIWLHEGYVNQVPSVVEKSRDVGVTWCTLVYFAWRFLYQKNSAIAMYSFKLEEVDSRSSTALFAKFEDILKYIPRCLRPNYTRTYKNFKCGDNVVEALSGDNPARGRRYTVVWCDEEAFYRQSATVDASLSRVTDFYLSTSSHNGVNTLFYSKTISEFYNKFKFEWFDVSWHTQEWYNKNRAIEVSKGLLHKFKQEVDCDPTGSLDMTVFEHGWIKAASENILVQPNDSVIAGLDIGANHDKTALALRRGGHIFKLFQFGDIDGLAETIATVYHVHGVELIVYDANGVGFHLGKRLRELGLNTKAYHDADGVLYPQSYQYHPTIMNGHLFANRKAQLYWDVRRRLISTYEYLERNVIPEKEEWLMRIEPELFTQFRELRGQFAQPTYKTSNTGKFLIEKAAEGQKSPDLIDAIVMSFAAEGSFKIKFAGTTK